MGNGKSLLTVMLKNELNKLFVQQDLEEEGIDYYGMQYRNNKPIIDALMNNPEGLFYMFDDATKNCEDYTYITSIICISLTLLLI